MIFKSKLIKGLLIIAILVTAVKQILLTQVIYALSSGAIISSSPTSGNESTNILPTDKDEVRPYKWKDQEVTLKKYVETNGQQMIEMEKEIADSSLTPDQKKRLRFLDCFLTLVVMRRLIPKTVSMPRRPWDSPNILLL